MIKSLARKPGDFRRLENPLKPQKNRGKPPPATVLRSEHVAITPPARPLARGVPLKYNEIVGARICELLANGKSMQRIMADHHDEGIPQAMSTIYRWLRDFPDFAAQYTQARRDQQQFYVDQLLNIADDEKIPSDQKRVMVDVRKWLASKLLPEQYGDRVRAEVTGADGGPVQVQATVVDASSLDATARDALKAALMAVRGKREDDDT